MPNAIIWSVAVSAFQRSVEWSMYFGAKFPIVVHFPAAIIAWLTHVAVSPRSTRYSTMNTGIWIRRGKHPPSGLILFSW